MPEWIIRGCRLPEREAPHDVALAGGRIAAVAPRLPAGAREIRADGALLLPGFVNGRVGAGPVGDDFEGRVALALERALRHGTTTLRLTAGLDPDEPLMPLRLLARLRARYAERLGVKLALGVPASLLGRPAQLRHLLPQAARAGADAVELSLGPEDLARAGVSDVLAAAQDAALALDVAIDEALPPGPIAPGDLGLPRLLDALGAAAFARPVRVLHASALAAVEADRLAPLLGELARRRIGLVVCPVQALHHGGRADPAGARRGLPRLRELLAAGVTLGLGTGALGGDAARLATLDPLDLAWLAGYASHMGVPAALDALRPALGGGRVEPGEPADLVLLDAPTFARAVIDHAEKRCVFKAGRLVSQAARITERPAATPDAERRLTIRGATLPGRPGRHDVVIADGVIRAIAPRADGADGPEILAEGRLVVPAFVDAHLHVDKTFVMERVALGEANLTVGEAVAAMRGVKAAYTREDLLARGRETLGRALRHGTTAVRAQCDVDPIVGLLALEALVELRREFAALMDVQLVAFPQEGLLADPRAGDLVRRALSAGADVVGGGPLDADWRAHIGQAFDLAREAGAPVDIHADLAIDGLRPVAEWEAPLIAARAKADGWQGRAAIGHFAGSSALTAEALRPLADALAEAGVSVAALCASEMYRQGMADRVNSRRGVPRVRDLLAAGVNVVFASNNIRDAFVTFGNADMLEQARLGALATHLDDADLALAMVTTRPATLMGLHRRNAVEMGKDADLVVLDAWNAAEALAEQVEKLYVIRRGRIVVRNAVDVRPGGAPA